MCGGRFSDGLDTSADVQIFKDLFEAYGMETICYDGSTFNDIYTYKFDDYPFGCTHNEIVIISGHGKESYILDYSLNNIYG